jgi:hypothetical protein
MVWQIGKGMTTQKEMNMSALRVDGMGLSLCLCQGLPSTCTLVGRPWVLYACPVVNNALQHSDLLNLCCNAFAFELEGRTARVA